MAVKKKKKNTQRVERKIEQLKKTALNSLYENRGNVSVACAAVNIGRTQFYNWQKNDPAFQEAVENVTEFTIDQVENQLHSNIDKGDTTAIIFYLKCRAKKRGYVERTEVDHSGSVGVNWIENKTYIEPDNGSNG